MNKVWWTKVTNASHFLDKIVDTVQNGQSIILQLPDTVPWYETMKEIVETRIEGQNPTRFYRYIEDMVEDPGEYLFYEFCKKEKRVHYRPGIGYAEFLAKNEDIVLTDSILWIAKTSEENLIKWAKLIEDYNKALGKHKEGCIFIVEARNNPAGAAVKEKKGLRNISYAREIGHYDNYLFNVLATSSSPEKEIFKQYLAEVVSIMLPDDIELSALCIEKGRAFLENPLGVIREISSTKTRSDGRNFGADIGEEDLQERLWEAQIKVIFPLVERQRNVLVQKYQREIEGLLPIVAAYGEEFLEASEVELGILSYLAGSGQIQLQYEDVEKLNKLKNARNVLAHIRTLPQEEVDGIFAL